MVDEKAVETGQFSQPAQSEGSLANAGYYQPHQLADLEKLGRLYLVADGLGSATSQIASQYVIKKILYSFYNGEPPTDPQEKLLKVIQQVNQEIFDRNSQQPERRVMGTTLVAALIHQNKLVVARVGDGQVYVVWDQDVERLTQPIGGEALKAVENATVAKEGAVKLLPAKVEPAPDNLFQALAQAPPRERLPQALGVDKMVDIDVFARRLFAGDVVILSSGGINGYVAEKEIARAVTRHPPDQALRRIVALGRERGSYEHVALSLTRVLSNSVVVHPPDPMPLPAEPKWSDWAATPKPLNSAEVQPTQPNSPTATQPMGQPETKTARPFTEGLPTINWRGRPRRPEWHWYTYAILTLILVSLCAVPVLAWLYLDPAQLVASIFLDDETPENVPAAAAAETTAEDETALAPEATATVETLPTATAGPTSASSAGDSLAAESNSPIPTPTSQSASPVSTPTVVVSSTVTARLVVPSPTPAPTIQVPAGCESKARFNGDLTIPDGTQFTPGETFEKIWRIQNAGTCPWGPGYTVRFIGGEMMSTNSEAPLVERVEPNGNGEIAVSLVAPETPGTFRGDWQLFDLQGEPFGPEMYLEIEVVPPDASQVDTADITVLYDFIEKAGEAIWTSQNQSYVVRQTEISETLELPAPQGLVATGIAQLRGNAWSEEAALLTYPHQEIGFIQGSYQVPTPLQPSDSLIASLGFTKLSILSDDGVTFEVGFTPTGGEERLLLSREVQYQDSPVDVAVPLTDIEPGQSGTFTLRVEGGESLSQDWALWLDLRLVRP